MTHTAVRLEIISGQLWFYTSVTENGNCLEPLLQRTLPGFLLQNCHVRNMQECGYAVLQDLYMALDFETRLVLFAPFPPPLPLHPSPT